MVALCRSTFAGDRKSNTIHNQAALIQVKFTTAMKTSQSPYCILLLTPDDPQLHNYAKLEKQYRKNFCERSFHSCLFRNVWLGLLHKVTEIRH